MTPESVAKQLYETYCKAVGGKAFNGDLLPDWETFRNDSKKQLQVSGWIAVGREAYELWRDS